MPAENVIRTIRLLPKSDCVSTTIPTEFASHELVDGKFFYTIPEQMLNSVVNGVGHARGVGAENFDADLIRLELALGEICGDHSLRVGFHFGQPLLSMRLHPVPIVIAEDQKEAAGDLTGHASLEDKVKFINERIGRPVAQARAYLGWLLTNQDFLAERDEFCHSARKQIRAAGFPGAVQVPLPGTVGRQRRVNDPRNWTHRFRKLCEKWRLQTFIGPWLPEPLPLQASGKALGAKHVEGVANLSIPDIYSISGGGDVSEIVADALGVEHTPPEHLAEWFAINSRHNLSRNTIAAYSRRFELQHFMRVLYSRHADSLYRQGPRVREAMAEWLNVNEEVIRKDLQWLNGKLGRDWLTEPMPV